MRIAIVAAIGAGCSTSPVTTPPTTSVPSPTTCKADPMIPTAARRTLLAPDEIDALARETDALHASRPIEEDERIRIELALEPEYVRIGPLRAELRVTSGSTRWFSRLAVDVEVRDDAGTVVFHRRPSLASIRAESLHWDEDLGDEMVGVASDYPALLPIAIDSNCLVASQSYRVDVRLFRPLWMYERASGSFRLRAPTDAELARRATFGADPYTTDLAAYATSGDLSAALSTPLGATAPTDPWRMLTLLAHAYAGPAAPSRADAERLGGGAFRFSAEELGRALDPDDPRHLPFTRARDRRQRAEPSSR